MSSYILGITNKLQLFIPFFSVANVFKLFPGDKSFTYRQVVENFCFLGGGGVVGSAVETEGRSVVTNRQSYINWKIRTNYLQPMLEDRKNSTESNGGGGGGEIG